MIRSFYIMTMEECVLNGLHKGLTSDTTLLGEHVQLYAKLIL